MNEQLKRFLTDLIIVLQDKYNESLEEKKSENELDKAFKNGKNFAYYDSLDLIESQLKVFGYNSEQIGQICPELSKIAKLN